MLMTAVAFFKKLNFFMRHSIEGGVYQRVVCIRARCVSEGGVYQRAVCIRGRCSSDIDKLSISYSIDKSINHSIKRFGAYCPHLQLNKGLLDNFSKSAMFWRAVFVGQCLLDEILDANAPYKVQQL